MKPIGSNHPGSWKRGNDRSSLEDLAERTSRPIRVSAVSEKLLRVTVQPSETTHAEPELGDARHRIAMPDLEVEAQIHAAGLGLISAFTSDLFDFIDQGLKRSEGPDWLVNLQAHDLTVGEVNYRDPSVLLKELAHKGQTPLRKPVSTMIPQANWKDFYKRLQEVLGERHLWVHNEVRTDPDQLKSLVVLINKLAWALELKVTRECRALLDLMNPEKIDEEDEMEPEEPTSTPSPIVGILGAFTGEGEQEVGSAVAGPFTSVSYTLHMNGSIRDRSTGELLEDLVDEAGSIGALLIARKPSGGRLKVTTAGVLAAYFGDHWGYLATINPTNWFPGHLE